MATLRPRLRLLLALTLALLSACSGGAVGPTAGTPTTSQFPVNLVSAGVSVAITHRPSRIISLSPSATEDLYAVGAGKQVIAVDPDSTYPPQAPRTQLSGLTPNIEAIANYHPDLVLVSGDANHMVDALAKLQIPVLLEPAPTNFDGIYTQIEQIALATGHSDEARKVVASMRHDVMEVVRSVPRPNRPLSVYHELDQTFYSLTSRTFVGQMYGLLGLRNIADGAGGSSDYPQLSAEYIVASNPDLIVLADTVCCGQTRQTVAARPGWESIAAVRTGEVVTIDDSIASEWGPRVVVLLRAVANSVRSLEAQAK